MMFGKGKLTVEDVQKDPDVYNGLFELIKKDLTKGNDDSLVKENKELKERLEKLENNNKIKEYGEKLKVDTTNLIDKSFNEALLTMVDQHIKEEKDIANSFEETASEAVGITPKTKENGGNDIEPTNFHEAMILIKKRDNCTMMEAVEKAKVEFKSLFDKTYDKMNLGKGKETDDEDDDLDESDGK
jgi:hypothetical protein